jgi:hypothetical protein
MEHIMNHLEDEFKELRDKVEAKLNEACKALHEANLLVTENSKLLNLHEFANMVNSHDDYETYFQGELFNEIDNAGWSSSSLEC